MRLGWKWLVLAACNILLLALTAMVNDGLAAWGMSLFIAGPCVIFPALQLRSLGVILCLLVSGLAGEAQWPTPTGLLTTLLVLGAGLVIAVRPWFGQNRRVQQLALAWLLNGVYFFIFTIWAKTRGGAAGVVFWERVAVDFCLSQLILLPVALWFFDFQECVLRLAGFAEDRPRGAVRR